MHLSDYRPNTYICVEHIDLPSAFRKVDTPFICLYFMSYILFSINNYRSMQFFIVIGNVKEMQM